MFKGCLLQISLGPFHEYLDPYYAKINRKLSMKTVISTKLRENVIAVISLNVCTSHSQLIKNVRLL